MTLEKPPIWTLAPTTQALYSLWGKTLRLLPLLGVGALILAFMLPIARFLAGVSGRASRRRLDSAILTVFVQRGVWLAVTLLGVYLALQVSGLTRLAATVLGGTSLLDLAFGFAFRDIAENFLSGILLSMRRPFALGDTIEAAGQTGVVRAVTSGGTQLIDFDGNVVRLSNTILYKGVIRNLTSNPKSRESFLIGIGYDASIEDAQKVLLGVMRDHDTVLDDPDPTVLVKDLGSSTVNLEAFFWVDAKRFSRARVRSSIMRSALGALTRAGINMPDDGREVLFPAPLSIQILRHRDRIEAEAKVEKDVTQVPEPASNGTGPGGEGSLSSEVGELQEQADASRSTEAGGGLLESKHAAMPPPLKEQ